ncbi:MAG: leucine-rich repeat domain-containing protein, partial [Oscillospiraceae bacterium]|nr:leucine-rich repeat domain-containing protein [Oscillospiraceae bacterium]
LNKNKTLIYTVPRTKKNVAIPKTVKRIEDHAFSGSTKLQSITIPASVREIGEYAFSGCTALTKVKLPKKLEKVEFMAFFNCMELKSITIPKDVKELYRGAFGLYYDKEHGDWDDCAVVPDFKIKCYKDSEGEEYAKFSGIDYVYIKD